MSPQQKTEAETCDHEWEFIDESFSHEFGTEVLHSWECQKCGETVNKCPFREDEP